jgi:hypothetical protein
VVDRHAEARVLERVVPEVADRAFALMRDRAALKALVEAETPADASEIALALDGSATPPHLVVTRSGRAVTCLAAGMHASGTPIPFAVVERELARRATALRVSVAVHAHNAIDGERPLERLVGHPEELGRDDFALVDRLFPLVESAFANAIEQTVARLSSAAHTSHLSLDDDAARALFRMMLFSSHALLSGRASERVLPHALDALRLDDAVLAPRALWILANRPEPVLAVLDALVEKTKTLPPAWARLLVVIGARHQAHSSVCARLLARAGVEAAIPDVKDGKTALVFWLHMPLLLGRFCPTSVRDMPAAVRHAVVDEARRAVSGQTLPWRAVAQRLGPWFVRIADILDVERWLSHPSPDVLVTPAQHQGERVRLILWRAMLTRAFVPLAALPVEVQLGLSAAPFGALVPRARAEPFFRAARAPILARAAISEIASRRRRDADPVVREKTPGRNDPCPCGSGKKYKACHGKP